MAGSAKLLTGKQLLENGGKKSESFLPTKGTKSVIPSGSWLEKKQVESALEERKRVIGDQRVEKRSSLSQANWLEEEQVALVLEKKGSYWLHMGQSRNSETYLLPEETLHLMEMNSLELKYGGVPVSIQQAYTLLIGKSVTLNEYRVYSLLSKQGYKLMRYNECRIYAKEKNGKKDSANCNPSGQINSNKSNKNSVIAGECYLGSCTNNNLETPKSPKKDCKNGHTEISPENNIIEDVSMENLTEEKVSSDDLKNTDVSKTDPNNEICIEFAKDDEIENCVEVNQDIPEVAQLAESISNNIVDESTEKVSQDSCSQEIMEDETVLITDSVDIDIDNDKENSTMDIDSSSDDCMVVGDTECSDISSTRHSVEKPKEIDVETNNESDSVEVECLPSFSSKMKILDSIPNCYRQNVLYLKAPNQKLIPPEIKLSKQNYKLILHKFSNKSNRNDGETNLNNYYNDFSHNSRNPNSKCITNFSHEENLRQNTNTQNHRNFDSHYMGGNNFANNTYFWNHIFQNSAYRQANFLNYPQFPFGNGMFGRMNNFSNNFRQRPFFFPQIPHRSQFSSNMFFNIFNRPFMFPNNLHNSSFPSYNSFGSRRENNFSEVSHAPKRNNPSQSNRKQRQNRNNQCHKTSLISPKTTSSQKSEDETNNSTSVSANNPLSREIMSQINALISRYSSLSPSEQKTGNLRKALKQTVNGFNLLFNENYTLKFKNYRCCLIKKNHNKVPLNSPRNPSHTDSENVLVSSDSDCSPVKVSRFSTCSSFSDSVVKRKVQMKSRAERRNSETNSRILVSTSHSSSDSDFDLPSSSGNEKKNSQSRNDPINLQKSAKNNSGKERAHLLEQPNECNIEIYSENKQNGVRNHTNDSAMFGDWYPKKGSWNEPVISCKPKHCQTLLTNPYISYTILNNIRELSYEKEYSIESWAQAKKMFEIRTDSETVFISDDESTPNYPAEPRLNELTIKIDKTHPLVRPEDCKSVSTVLDRLQIIGSAYDDQSCGEKAENSEKLKISYDMYLPNFKTLRKSDPPPPAYSVIVLSDTCQIPSPAALSEVSESVHSCVPFLLAVVSFDAVSFVQMEHITLPNMERSSEI